MSTELPPPGLLEGTRVLVTGGSGFLGQHLLKALVLRNAEVSALVRDPGELAWTSFRKREPKIAEQITLWRGDLLDEANVEAAVAGAEIVLHLAGRGGAKGTFKDFCDANIMGTCNVLTACTRRSVGRLIFASTAAVYGTGLSEPANESSPLSARSIYAASKLAAEALVQAYAAAGSSTVTLRFSNIYGPHQATETVITTLLRQLQTNDIVTLRSLVPVRDFLFVDDAVDAVLAAAVRPNVPHGAVLNVSTGVGYSVGKLVEAAITAVHRREPARTFAIRSISNDDGITSPLDCLICDNSAARAALDWCPRVNLKDGMDASYASLTGERFRRKD